MDFCDRTQACDRNEEITMDSPRDDHADRPRHAPISGRIASGGSCGFPAAAP